jgi:tRNA (guanine37-N1)-methyltransferase
MKIHLLTIFPNIFSSYLSEGILKRAIDSGQVELSIRNIRDWTIDRHRTVDDSPYGGGAGMLMKIEPLYKAIDEIAGNWKGNKQKKVILMSASGKKWKQAEAKKYSEKIEEMLIICGRYEGVDARIKKFIDQEISIGDYVLTGGELPALIVIDSISRLLPGVLGNSESPVEESHSQEGILEYPQYTRPEVFEANGKKLRVPKVLIQGNHAKIKAWREEHQKKLDKKSREI